VAVSLTKLSTGIKSDQYTETTRVNASVASQDMADNLLYEALRESIERLDYEVAANEINKYAAKNKK
jgi:hypothetical protein